MKFDELKVEQLKKELYRLDLSTAGTKAELQRRLIEEFRRRGIDIDTYDFDEKEEPQVLTGAPAGNMDFSAMFAALMAKFEETNKKIEETNKKMEEDSRVSCEKMMAEIKESKNEIKESTNAEFHVVKESIRATNEKLREISEAINKRVDKTEVKASRTDEEQSDSGKGVGEENKSVLSRESSSLSGNEDFEKSARSIESANDKHPFIKSDDFRDEGAKQQTDKLWYEEENRQIKDFVLDGLAKDFKSEGVSVFGEGQKDGVNNLSMGKNVKRRLHHEIVEKQTEKEANENAEDNSEIKMAGDKSTKPTAKKMRLTEDKFSSGATVIKGQKTYSGLSHSVWNRCPYNDSTLSFWFVQGNEVHIKKPVQVTRKLSRGYQRKVQELNTRPVEKAIQAKVRKRRRVSKGLHRPKKKKKKKKYLGNADAPAVYTEVH